MLGSWEDLDFFRSGDWEAAQEKLDAEVTLCPDRIHLFAALEATPYSNVSVAILGQDPYPNRAHATGIAFSVPHRTKTLPASLRNIFTEYSSDLGYPTPNSGDLSPWTQRGILLWNVYPSCREGQPGSHAWPEWDVLTQEIVERLDEKGNVVFAFLGRVARYYNRYVNRCPVVTTSHPSPLGARQGFLGSHLFSTINSQLKVPIDWRL